MSKKESLLQQYSDYLRMRNYSEMTYKAYMGSVRMFWDFCEQRKNDPKFKKDQAVQIYLSYRLQDQKRNYSTVNGDYSALQWFYKYVLDRAWNVRKLVRPRKEKRLPRYITPIQMSQLLEATSYQKHRLLFLLYYSTGLRLSEGRLLRWEDVSLEEGLIHVRKGKGSKDRIAILQAELRDLLLAYRQTLPVRQELVFAGNSYKKPLAARSIQHVFKKCRDKAGLPAWVTAHVLRHSYATISLTNGTDLLSLKQLLGHKKLSTTTRYLHLNTAHLKTAHNPLSHQCLSVPLQATQQSLPSVK